MTRVIVNDMAGDYFRLKKGAVTMNYYFIVLAVIILLIIIFEFVNGLLNSQNDGSLSTGMISAGLGLVVTAFPGVIDTLVAFMGITLTGEMQASENNIISIICGVILMIAGCISSLVMKDRIFVLNMLGLFSQFEISDIKNIKDLKLADFKVKEIVIDFVDIYKSDDKMTDKVNEMIINKIEKQCNTFKDRSKEFESCYTGMGPIPYTILAGTYLANSQIERYFEYKRSDNKYYELSRKSKYPELKEVFPSNKKMNAKEVIVAISITRNVQECDMAQFGDMDIIRLEVDIPADNFIISKKQLNDYKIKILNCLEKIKVEYSQIECIHLLTSIPSCMSLEIGKMIALNNNRLPKVVSHHYVNAETPKYPFGIVVTENTFNNEKGKLIKN